MRNRSLLRQTIALVVAAQLLCAALLGGAALVHEWRTHRRAFDIRLEGRSDSLLGAIQDAEDPDDNVRVDPAELNLPDDDVYAVYNQGGRLLGSSHDAPPILIFRSADELRDVRVGRTRYRVLEREAIRVIDRAENGGIGLKRPVTIVYASPEKHFWHEIFEAVRFYLLAITVATGLTVLLLTMLLRRAFSPLSELAAAAAQLAPPALRFSAPQSVLQVRELRPLADALTDSVRRLREAFAKEQRFLGDAAHELKTSIAVVRSSVQLLMLKRRTTEVYAAGLGRVLEDTRRVEMLVAQMLQLASMESATTLNIAAIDLGELTASALEYLEPLAEERRVALRFETSVCMRVRLIPERALSLISNLVLNAIQHSAPESVVSVSLTSSTEGTVMLKVQDAGTGIAADALPHLFERFYREDHSRSRDTGGAGLGLSICRVIVEAAGGSISVESSLGQGTCVRVLFEHVSHTNDPLVTPRHAEASREKSG